MSETTSNFEKLKADLKVVGNDLSLVGRQLLDTLGEKADTAAAKVQDAAKTLPGKTKETVAAGVAATQQQVKEKPLAALGLAAAAGALVALALKRK